MLQAVQGKRWLPHRNDCEKLDGALEGLPLSGA
jgi:hypothetical protein